MTKQQRIDILEKSLEEARKDYHELQKKADEGFEASPEYIRMKQDIRMYELMEGLAERKIESDIRGDWKLIEQMRKIREDNANLCKEHGVEYWEGLTDSRYKYRDVRDYEKRVEALEAKVAAKDVIIEHLKDLLAGRDPDTPRVTVMGRRPVPEDQKKRIRSYRRKGFTLKEISEMEGVSLGAVSGICKGIKPKKKNEDSTK